ncbi:MAG: hypothetical protein ACK5PR_02820 [bacterium]|jgi:hypothetical protein
MNRLNREEALKVLGLSQVSGVEDQVLEARFQQLVRRYPNETFPDRFSVIREAYEILKDPMNEFRNLLHDDMIDLSSYLEPIEPLNRLPGSEAELRLVRMLGVLLGEHCLKVLEASDDEDFEDSDEPESWMDLGSMEEMIEELLSGMEREARGKRRR